MLGETLGLQEVASPPARYRKSALEAAVTMVFQVSGFICECGLLEGRMVGQ